VIAGAAGPGLPGVTSAGDHALAAAAVAAGALGIVAGGLRWLRVAQREHYLSGSATRFALRWWLRSRPVNAVGLVLALAGAGLAPFWPATAFATAAVTVGGPIGLSVRGRSSPLAWTRRLRTLAAVWAALEIAAVGGAAVAGLGPRVAALGAVLAPIFVDAACVLVSPLERKLAGAHVRRAAARLRRVGPTVVAITGSYGKTSTKGYVAHLLAATHSVVASPASFNNRAGLARAVNEHLAEGTDVFVAEMGTYGPGEIAELCAFVPPDVAVITAIGPVHLERFGSEERIVAAKSEILARAPCAVLVVDDPRLAALAANPGPATTTVWRVSSHDLGAGVTVSEEAGALVLYVRGERVGEVRDVDARPGNVAAAAAVALQLGVPPADVVRRLATLPTAPHRLERAQAPGGFVVLDDTYNANPAGARAALSSLGRQGQGATRRVVVTPGMVELGARQGEENTILGREAAAAATDVVVVGRTNRRALRRGAPGAVAVETRQEAAEWVRARLGPGDVVLYENDLPDHYP